MFQRLLLISYAIIWLLLAIQPRYRDDWLLENLLVFAALPVLFWLHRRRPFSKSAAGLLWIFFVSMLSAPLHLRTDALAQRAG